MIAVKDTGFAWRAGFLGVILLAIFTTISWRLFQFHIVEHEELQAEAVRNRMRSVELPARRGEIHDRNGELLARDRAMQEVYLDKNHFYRGGGLLRTYAKMTKLTSRDLSLNYTKSEIERMCLDRLAAEMAGLLGVTPQKARDMLDNKPPLEIVLSPSVEQEIASNWEKMITDYDLKGVYLRPVFRRLYPIKDYMVPIIGTVNHEDKGVEGIERSMDKVLAGTPGKRVYEADARRRPVPAFPVSLTKPVDGGSVKLTLDGALQEKIERLAEAARTKYEAEKVILVVTRPKTGEIVAMAGSPGYQRSDSGVARRNIVLTDSFEPGSIFKIVSFAAAFDDNKARPTDNIFCHWGKYGDRLTNPLHDCGSYGDLMALDVLAKSSNIGTYKIAMAVGKQKFANYIKAFGFGVKSGLPLDGEHPGLVWGADKWKSDSFSRISIGHEITVNAIQMAMAGGVIANGGSLMEPQLVREVRDEAGNVITPFTPREKRRVISPEAARDVTEAMVRVVTDGTGKTAAIPGFTVAGKTGTAEKVNLKDGGYYSDRYVVSFIGFLTGVDSSLLALAIVDDPKNAVQERYGSVIAAPLWRDAILITLEHEGLLPGATIMTSTPPSENP
jgi:cell division protein FtsI/penicillin-binding protein 2